MKIKLIKEVIAPKRIHETDAGFTIFIPQDFVLWPYYIVGHQNVIETGIAIEMPSGHFGLIKELPELALRGMIISGNVIDWGFRQEIKIICGNISDTPISFKAGEKLAQIIVQPFFSFKDIEIVESVKKSIKDLSCYDGNLTGVPEEKR